MSGDDLRNALQCKSSVSFPAGTLLTVYGVTRVDGEYGEFALANYGAVIDGKRETGKVKLPNGVLEQTTLTPPCFLLYEGMKTTKSGRTCHAASSYRPEDLTAENVERKADELRRLPPAALDALISCQTLNAFAPGTMFLVRNPVRKTSKREGADALYVDFEAVVGDATVTGTLLLPCRLETQLRQDDAVVLWYGGMLPTKDGNNYHDVKVMDEAMTAAILKTGQ